MYNIISEANVFVFGFEGLALKRWAGGWAHVSHCWGPRPAGIIKYKLSLDPYFITGFSDVVDFIAPVSLSSCYIRASIAPQPVWWLPLG